MRALASQLRAGDVVNVVTWNTEQNVLLDNHAVQGADDPALIAVADGLDAEGGTDLNAGLVRGYALATQTFAPERLNRLILISDGGANVGVTNAELIAQHSGLNDDEGIYLVGIGTGPVQSYTDALMDTVTDAGRGAYVYLDSIEEADRILRDRFDEVMEVAARGVQIELTLPWYYRMHRFYGEEYSKDPKEVKPQHLAPGDTMVLLQTLQACDASLVSDKDPVRVRVRWNEPISHLQREVASETTLGALALGGAAQLHKAQAIVAAAEALKDPSTEAMIEARASIERADPEGQDDDLLELEELLNRMD
jgi:Ca-activated chloride channel family protein